MNIRETASLDRFGIWVKAIMVGGKMMISFIEFVYYLSGGVLFE